MGKYLDAANEAMKHISSPNGAATTPEVFQSEFGRLLGEQGSALTTLPPETKPIQIPCQLIDGPEELQAWADEARRSPPDLLTIDIESSGLNYGKDHICGIAINAWSKNVYVAFGHHDQGRLSRDDARKLLNPIFSRPIPKLGHNFTFDASFLSIEGFNLSPPFYDTRLIAKEIHSRDSNVRYGLKDLACRHLDPNADYWDRQLESLLKSRFRAKKKDNLWRLAPSEVCEYACADVYFTRRLFDLFKDQIRARPESAAYLKLERLASEICVNMTVAGLSINEQDLKGWLEEARGLLQAVDDELCTTFGITNVNFNSPKQVLPLLKAMGYEPVNPKRGNQSICLESLERLNAPSEAIKLLIRRTRIANQVRQLGGVLEFALNGRVYPHIKVSANTGERFNATNPPLFTGKRKPLPGEVTLRTFVTPHVNHALVFFDIQASHFRLMAHLSGDENMAAIFQSGRDFHRASAALLYGFDYDDPRAGELRNKSKPLGFSVVYGGGPAWIAKSIGIRKADAILLKRRYLYDVFPKLGPYIDQMEQQARDLGYVRTGMLGVKVAVPRDRAYVAINYQLQATEAELLKKIIVRGNEFLRGRKSSVALPFHDEVVFQIHRDEYDLIPDLRLAVESAEPRLQVVTDASISETTWSEKIPYDEWFARKREQ